MAEALAENCREIQGGEVMKKKLVEAFLWTCAVMMSLLGIAGAMTIVALITFGLIRLFS